MSKLNVLCAFCSEPLDDSSLETWAEASSNCDTCGPETNMATEIFCRNPNCVKFDKIIYTK